MAEIKSDVNHIHTLPDFVQGGLDYLPGDFLAEKVNLVTFLTVYLKRLEDVDKMLVGLAEGRLLNNASGRYLDEVGNQLGILRNGLSDADFRATLIIQQAAASRAGLAKMSSPPCDNCSEETISIRGKETTSGLT